MEISDKDDSYVIIISLDKEGCWLTSRQAEQVEALLAEQGWDVEIREPLSHSESHGTYCRRRDGTLQILGYSIPKPQAFTDALESAANRLI